MNTTPISFEELRNALRDCSINDSNSAVMIAVVFPDGQDWNEVQDFLSNDLGFSKGKNLIGCRRITGNVLGDGGRTDYLMEFDNPAIPFNPIARLRFSDIKWTSDFVDIFAKDYDEEAYRQNLREKEEMKRRTRGISK